MKLLMAIFIVVAGMAQAEPVRDVVTMTNAFRAKNGLPPLVASPVLEAVAEVQGHDMAKRGFFGHKGSDGSTVGKRAKRKGYRYCVIAENIAKGQRSSGEVMASWVKSQGHRRNMLVKNLREIGVIRAPGNIWVMVLGTRRGGC
ncbi:CAP domain-containing protein [Aquicoccus sp. G2-2]|uniref:CAP domain-containing protein n=1 Tax=Aquicoccus sp. G2-2 TaxID=3092120 RepID=UPI002AE02001|nr:CAP domain-containing protein [Aquicoccus sp. G2-2]MEA1114184.1 CAP domain-containing protein [Aquicoccus sp. G2-2]